MRLTAVLINLIRVKLLQNLKFSKIFRSPGKTSELEAAGAKVYGTKKEIVANCDILFACVSGMKSSLDSTALTT